MGIRAGTQVQLASHATIALFCSAWRAVPSSVAAQPTIGSKKSVRLAGSFRYE